jgi:superfamily II DNA or RNA helicase/HKD family nuclease
MSLIDNQSQTMHQALINALSTAGRIDIQVGYFYFSGFELLAKHLKDKQVRILVGKQIDPNAVPNIISMQQKTGKPVDLERFQSWDTFVSRTEQKSKYFEGFSKLFNESQVFDSPESQEAYKIFEEKIIDGSLQIKLTNNDEHGKMYLVYNKPEMNQGGDFPGTMFLGSSNFTYNGLIDQGELNKTDRDKASFEEATSKFEAMWSESQNIDIATPDNNQEFKEVVKKLWINTVVKPYLMYIRVLHELFGKDRNTDIESPGKITDDSFIDLEYQLDAIRMGIDRINQYGGVIVADVVGLGKSIIASAIAYNIAQKDRINVVIICPPHLITQWEEYQAHFRLPGTKIFSSGKIEDAYRWCTDQVTGPVLLVLDEAHRYRNELTDDYTLLHSLSRSNPNNKVVVLTATPFNNDPKDVFALVKLFQTPGQSTIRSVDNLSLRFRELIDRYKKLRSSMRKNNLTNDEINDEAKEIALELRRLIEPVIVRRSRLDLQTISRYRNNLIKQGIAFAKVEGPELLEYELGDLFDLYLNTLETLTNEDHGFIGARYKPVTYIADEKRDEFKEKYGAYLDDVDLQTAQSNLASFMKRLLVMRFESSKEAFRITLQNMIDSNQMIARWYHDQGRVPILKKGRIPDPDTFMTDAGDDITSELDEQFNEESDSKYKLLFVEKDWLKPEFIKEVESDTQLLLSIRDQWFSNNKAIIDLDPKLDSLVENIKRLLNENPDRKIVIFSAYADTVDYLGDAIKKAGFSRVYKYTAKDASKANRELLRSNFDAGIKPELQANDYDVLVATDALSEGYNLHRAGVIFNYDIPFNPTRVIQRIGRINRINKKVFDSIFVYNFFPTTIGEAETRIQQISTLKMTLINAVVGSDTKTLTSDEELKSFFKDEYVKANQEAEFESWDAKHREAYDQTPDEVIDEAMNIRPRSRVMRSGQTFNGGIAFGKKGNHAVFAIKRSEDEESKVVSAEEVLPLFAANRDEEGKAPDSGFNELFIVIRDKLFEKHKLPTIRGNRAKALQPLQILIEQYPPAKDYALDLMKVIKEYDDLSEGQYKQIGRVNMGNLEEAYKEIQKIVSKQTIATSLKRVDQLEGLSELIVLSEELRV